MGTVRTPPITVRVATMADLADVVALRLALLREYRDNIIYGRLRPDARERAERLFARQLSSPHEAIFLAHQDGHAVGILRCVQSTASPLLYPAEYGYISSVYVVPQLRRAGVLHLLFDEAVRWCSARGITELRLHNAAKNATANAAWDALGFEVVEVLRVRPLRRDEDS